MSQYINMSLSFWNFILFLFFFLPKVDSLCSLRDLRLSIANAHLLHIPETYSFVSERGLRLGLHMERVRRATSFMPKVRNVVYTHPVLCEYVLVTLSVSARFTVQGEDIPTVYNISVYWPGLWVHIFFFSLFSKVVLAPKLAVQPSLLSVTDREIQFRWKQPIRPLAPQAEAYVGTRDKQRRGDGETRRW